jgi:ankyrin repeat protein
VKKSILAIMIFCLVLSSCSKNGGSGEYLDIFKAVDADNLAAVERIIDRFPALVNCTDDDELPILHYSIKQGKVAIAEFLVRKGAKVNTGDKKYKYTPLHFAAEKNHKALVELLISKKADLNAGTVFNKTPLHLACFNGNLGVVIVLVENGAKVDQENDQGDMPLHDAAHAGETLIIRYLVEHAGANLHARNVNNITALHLAVFGDHLETAQYLHSLGLDVNDADGTQGITPLHIAAERGYEEMCRYLISKGAKVNVKDSTGRTPIELAEKYNHKKTAELLRKFAGK